MNDKKEAPRQRGNADRAGTEAAALAGVAGSKFDSTTDAGKEQVSIARFLGVGVENAVPLRDLTKWTGLDGRAARKLIEAERRTGTPICSGERGYWLAETREEIETFCRSMRRRAAEIQKTAALVQLAELDMEAVDNGG